MAADAYASADQAAMRIEKRLRRYKRRLKDHQATRADGQAPGERGAAIDAPSYVIAAPEHDADEEVTEWNPVIIAESTTALKRLSVSEAVMELDMTGAAGGGVPSCWTRPRQSGLPPRGRSYRLDRPAGHRPGRPLTGLERLPMVRRLWRRHSR